MCLVEGVDDGVTIEGVELEFGALVAFSSKGHVKREFAELVEVEVLVGSLLVEQWFQDGFITKHGCHPNQEVRCFLVLTKHLEQFGHHERELDQTLRVVRALFVVVVDRVGRGDDLLKVVLRVILVEGDFGK